MLKDNLKTLRKNKGLSQEELSVKLNVVRQTVSKWESGLSVPDAEMLIKISELFEIPVSEILGEDIEKKERDDLKVISEKLEVVNEQLSNFRKDKRKKKLQILIFIDISIVLLFILLALLNQPYLSWNYDIIEWAILGTFWQAFEWIFMRLAPIVIIVLTTIIIIKRNK